MCHKCEELRNGQDVHGILDKADKAAIDGLLQLKLRVLELGQLAQVVNDYLPVNDPRRMKWMATFDAMKAIDAEIVKLGAQIQVLIREGQPGATTTVPM